MRCTLASAFSFFFNDTATTEIYTLALHDALPISNNRLPYRRLEAEHASAYVARHDGRRGYRTAADKDGRGRGRVDRKSTRLNSSHANISYAVFCLKKKNAH